MSFANTAPSRRSLLLPWIIVCIGVVVSAMVYTRTSKINYNKNYLRDYFEISQSHFAIRQRLMLISSEISALKGFFLGSSDITPSEWQRFMNVVHHHKTKQFRTLSTLIHSIYYIENDGNFQKNCLPKFVFQNAPQTGISLPCPQIAPYLEGAEASSDHFISEKENNHVWLISPVPSSIDSIHTSSKPRGWLIMNMNKNGLFGPPEDATDPLLGVEIFQSHHGNLLQIYHSASALKSSPNRKSFLYFHHQRPRYASRQKSFGVSTGASDYLHLKETTGISNIRLYPDKKRVAYVMGNAITLESKLRLGDIHFLVKMWRPQEPSRTAYLATAFGLLITAFMAIVIWLQLRMRTRAEHIAISMTQELGKNEARLRAVLEGSNDGIWDYDVVNNRLWYSPRWYTMLGYADQELPYSHQTLKNLLHPEDKEWVLSSINDHMARGKSYDLQFRMLHKSGDYRWIRSRGFIKTESGNIIRVVGISSDITEERHYNSNLEIAKKEAEEASRAKAEFIANMSHEIRTPLNGIIGIIELLQGTSLSSKQLQYLNILESSSISLLEIVNEILDFSKIEAGQMHIEKVGFNLIKIATEAIEVAKQAARNKQNLAVMLRVAPDLPANFISDPTRIRQCLLNLLSNAVKFTASGHVLLTIDGTLRNDGDYDIYMKIQDTGIGIVPEKMETIFQKFTQADTSTTREYGGTGLGLAIVKTMVEMLGGEISVSSTPNEGSCFEIRIRMAVDAKVQNTSNILATHRQEKGHFMRILIVEDNLTNQQVLGWILDDAGYTYSVAANGQEALDILEKDTHFDCILMDCQMPIMDGFDATRAIRNMPHAIASIPIIALTANASKDDEKKSYEAGMNQFLIKPVDPRKLMESLGNLGGPKQSTPEAEATDSNIINAKKIHEITGGSSERMQRFLDLFQKTFLSETEGLHAAISANDIAIAKRHAHTLKGASANLYALKIQAISAQIEQHLKSENVNDASKHLPALHEAYKEFCAAYRAKFLETEH